MLRKLTFPEFSLRSQIRLNFVPNQYSIHILPPFLSNSIYITFSCLQTRSAVSSTSICTSTARTGDVSRGKRTRNGIVRSNISPCESVENRRHVVSVSSTRQPFVRIYEGKKRFTIQKNHSLSILQARRRASTRSTKRPQIWCTRRAASVKKVSLSFKGTIASLTILFFDNL